MNEQTVREVLVMRAVSTLLVTMLLAACAFGAAEAQKLPVIMVTDVAGLGDQGFNDAAWAGVKRAANA